MTQTSKRLRRDYRLRKRSDFQTCQTKGKRFFSRQFVVQFLAQAEGVQRLGLVVTRDTGGAVVRNRWKRMIRDCFRNIREEGLHAGDHVVMVRRSVKGSPDAAARSELLQLFDRIGKK